MKEHLKVVLKIVIFIIIFLVCFLLVYNVLKLKYAYRKSYDFFDQKEDFDVLCFGSSHMYTVIQPMQLWNDYGIVSFNLGQTSSTIPISYYNLLLACETHKPKLVVIDAYLTTDNQKVINKVNSMHNTFDPYPLSYTKYLAIKDLCDDENLLEKEIEFLFNFSMYHGRWKEITKDDFVFNARDIGKGAECRIGFYEWNSSFDLESIEPYSGDEAVNEKYLRKMIEYCRDNGIEVLVTYNPFPYEEKFVQESKYVKKICDEYDVNYINFLEMNIVDYKTDWYDASHVNQSGARKVTDYIGNYIMNNYNIPDQRNNPKYSFWKDDYNYYINYKIANLHANSTNPYNYLMMLQEEKDISYEVKIPSNINLNADEVLNELLNDLEYGYEINDDVFKENKEKILKITTYDKRNNKKIEELYF